VVNILHRKFASHICAQILEHGNFSSRVVFTDVSKFHISGRVNWYTRKRAIWGTHPPREHLERDRDSDKVNAWHALTCERVISPFFFVEDIITSSSFLDVLENYALLQLNNNSLVVQMDGAPVAVHS
jgi:hypothetical protein